MAGIVNHNKVVAVTLNLRQLTRDCSHKWRANDGVKRVRRAIQKQFQSRDEVKLDVDLNKALWALGRRRLPTKIRVEVSRRPDLRDSSKNVFYLRHIVVPTFKKLQCESTITE